MTTHARDYSFWGSTHPMSPMVDALNRLIPAIGACSDAKGENKALDAFRVASNLYYDVFNNGGLNYTPAQIRAVFPKYRVAKVRARRWDELYAVMDPIIEELIIAAVVEQLGKLPAAMDLGNRKL